MRKDFTPSKKYFKCKRCNKRVRRRGGCEKYCDECKPIIAKEGVARWAKEHKKKKGRKCRNCGTGIPRYRSYCDICRDLNLRESLQRSKEKGGIEKARIDLLSSIKKTYNVQQLRELSPEKFGKAVSKFLQGEATIVGVR